MACMGFDDWLMTETTYEVRYECHACGAYGDASYGPGAPEVGEKLDDVECCDNPDVYVTDVDTVT